MAGAEDSGENPFVNIRKELSEGARHINKEQGYNYELKLIEAKKTLINDIESKLAELPPLQMASAGSTVIASRAFAWFCNEGEPLVRIEGALIAIGTNNHVHPNIYFWNSNTGESYRTKGGHNEGGATVVYSPRGTTLASGGDDKTIKLWDVKSGECLRTMEGHRGWVRAVAFSPDGTTLASGSLDKTIKLWNVKSGECLRTQKGFAGERGAVSFSPDGATLASSSSANTVKLWNVNTGECLRTMEGHRGRVRSISFSPDGATLASGSSDHAIKLWNANTGECLRTMEGHSPRWIPEKAMPSGFVMPGYTTRACINSISFSSDGATLASGSDDHTIKLWNVNTGECLQTMEGHRHDVNSVAFSPDGANLVSGSMDCRFRLWNVNTGKCLRTVKVDSPLISVAFSPDDRTFSRLDLENIFREVQAMLGEAEFHLSTENGVKFTVSWDGLK